MERERAEKTLKLQRFRLKGLTALSLIEGEFISEKSMKQATLTNPIHPLFARTRWKSVLKVSRSYLCDFVDKGKVSGGFGLTGKGRLLECEEDMC